MFSHDGQLGAAGEGLPLRRREGRAIMTQGRKPVPEPDDARTLFEAPKESSGRVAERTPPSPTPTTPVAGRPTPNVTATNIDTAAFDRSGPSQTPGMKGFPTGELPSAS